MIDRLHAFVVVLMTVSVDFSLDMQNARLTYTTFGRDYIRFKCRLSSTVRNTSLPCTGVEVPSVQLQNFSRTSGAQRRPRVRTCSAAIIRSLQLTSTLAAQHVKFSGLLSLPRSCYLISASR